MQKYKYIIYINTRESERGKTVKSTFGKRGKEILTKFMASTLIVSMSLTNFLAVRRLHGYIRNREQGRVR